MVHSARAVIDEASFAWHLFQTLASWLARLVIHSFQTKAGYFSTCAFLSRLFAPIFVGVGHFENSCGSTNRSLTKMDTHAHFLEPKKAGTDSCFASMDS